MSTPAPPPGFTLESDDAPAQQGMPAPPPGFKLDEEAVAPPVKNSAENTWWGAVKGLGDAGLAVGSSGLKAVTHAVNDILPGAEGRASSRKRFKPTRF